MKRPRTAKSRKPLAPWLTDTPCRPPKLGPNCPVERARRAKLMRALARRFPGTTMITGPMPDEPDLGEVRITLLNAPIDPPMVVYNFASKTIREIWGDEWVTGFVSPVSRENTAKYYSQHLPKRRAARSRPQRRRRRAPAAATR